MLSDEDLDEQERAQLHLENEVGVRAWGRVWGRGRGKGRGKGRGEVGAHLLLDPLDLPHIFP